MNLEIVPYDEGIEQIVRKILMDYINPSEFYYQNNQLEKLEYDIGKIFHPLAKVSIKQNSENPYLADCSISFSKETDLVEFKYKYNYLLRG